MPTSLEYLHAVAAETNGYESYTTTSSGSTSTLVCSTLVNSALAASEFANAYLLIESGAAKGEVGQAKTLVRSTGTLSVSDPFSTTIASDVTFSLYRLLPPIQNGEGVPSLLQAINWALSRLHVEYVVSMTGVTAQVYYTVDTATYPWFTDVERIMWIEAPVASAQEVPRRLRAEEWDWETDGETCRLVFHGAPFKTGDTFKVRCFIPGNARLKKNGSWTNQTTQSAEMALYTSGTADEALPDVADVVTVATAFLYRALSRLKQPSAQVAEWLAKAQPSVRAANDLIRTGQAEDWTTGIVRMRPVRHAYLGARGW